MTGQTFSVRYVERFHFLNVLLLYYTGDTGGVERFVYETQAEPEPREDGSAAHRPPEARA